MYRKETFTGIGLNFYSYFPKLYKTNAILTLINRAYKVCSSWSTFSTEIDFLRSFFKNNYFPTYLLDKLCHTFLLNIFRPPSPISLAPKLNFFCLFPYLGNLTYQFIPQLTQLLTKSYPFMQPKLVFTNPLTIGSFFKFKDALPHLLKSGVIYKFNCPRCNHGTYVGSTKRMLKLRIDEHKGVSYRTNLPLSQPSKSAIRTHCFKCRHKIQHDNFKIISSAKNHLRLLINESLEIKQKQPTLNTDDSAIPLYIG